MTMKPTYDEANELVRIPKRIAAKLRWHCEGKGWKLSARAFGINGDEILEVRGYVGKVNHSFALLYHNFVLRKFTKHAPHKIGLNTFKEPHKHIWDGDSELKQAYIPEDINPNSDINDQFLCFCKECNIEITSEYQRVAFNLR